MVLQLEICLKRINKFLKFIGLSIDSKDSNRTVPERLKRHWVCLINIFSLNLSIAGQFTWLVQGIAFGSTLWEITYLLPCLTLCLLGVLKVFSFIGYMQHVNDLVKALRLLQSNSADYDEQINGEIKKWTAFLFSISNTLLILTSLGLTAFALGPFFIMASYYYTTGDTELFLPFLVSYPLDAFNIRNWPFIYFHQMWCAWVTVFFVYGPDCFFFTCCTFIQIQFLILQQNLEQIVKIRHRDGHDSSLDTFKAEFVQLVNRHRELLRCVGLLEIIYSKATLFNVVTSSLVICATGFNLMAIKNFALMLPFTAFLFFGMLQIFFYCYFGDYVMRSSMGVGDAIYKSQWYKTGAAERKYLLIVLVRSQKPCKLTAYGFTEVNLRAFTRILSTSWSYFALLKQMYHN